MTAAPGARGAVPQLVLGVLVQVLTLSCWFATAAAVPSLAVEFELSRSQTVLLAAAVQAGFAVGAVLVGLSRLSDRLRPAVLIPLGSIATAATTLLPLLDPSSLPVLVVSRVGTGVLLATVYPTGMRAAASWATPRWRGLAVSGMVAALTIGTAGPYLLEYAPVADWRGVLAVCASAAIVGALLGMLLRTGPRVGPPPSRSAVRPVGPSADRTRHRITAAYVGHMWEVYGLWVWLPALLSTIPALRSSDADRSLVGVLSFVVIGVVGAVGCLLAGGAAARFGKRSVASWSVALSGLCALATPLLPVLPIHVAVLVLALWSAAAIADSPLYSALVGDAASGRDVGSALALQMGFGYAISIGALFAVPAIAEATGWQWAFLVLAVGPLVSLIALRGIRRVT